MDYALSTTTGGQYAAWSVTYEQAKRLKLLCPVCRCKVYKAVRKHPHETHYFCHHSGGSPECELFHPSADFGPNDSSSAEPHGQDFELFANSVAADLRTLLVAAHVVQAPISDHLLLEVEHEAKSYEFDPSNEELDGLAAQAVELVVAMLGGEDGGVERRIAAICGFYRNTQARFVDFHLTAWLAYQVLQKDRTIEPERVVSAVVEDSELYFRYAAHMLGGLAMLYAQRELQGIWQPLTELCEEVASRLVEVQSPRRSRQAPAAPEKQHVAKEAPRAGPKSRATNRTAAGAVKELPMELWRLDEHQTLHSLVLDLHLRRDEWRVRFEGGEYFVVTLRDNHLIPFSAIVGSPSRAAMERARGPASPSTNHSSGSETSSVPAVDDVPLADWIVAGSQRPNRPANPQWIFRADSLELTRIKPRHTYQAGQYFRANGGQSGFRLGTGQFISDEIVIFE